MLKQFLDIFMHKCLFRKVAEYENKCFILRMNSG